MALIKKKMTMFGIEASYWKLSRFSLDTVRKEVSFTLNLYFDKNNQNMELENYSFASAILEEEEFSPIYEEYFGENKAEENKDLYKACYSYAKKYIEFFNDSLDG